MHKWNRSFGRNFEGWGVDKMWAAVTDNLDIQPRYEKIKSPMVLREFRRCLLFKVLWVRTGAVLSHQDTTLMYIQIKWRTDLMILINATCGMMWNAQYAHHLLPCFHICIQYIRRPPVDTDELHVWIPVSHMLWEKQWPSLPDEYCIDTIELTCKVTAVDELQM